MNLFCLRNIQRRPKLLDAVKDVDAMIIRSDKANAEVLEAAKNLKIIVIVLVQVMIISNLAAATAHNASS